MKNTNQICCLTLHAKPKGHWKFTHLSSRTIKSVPVWTQTPRRPVVDKSFCSGIYKQYEHGFDMSYQTSAPRGAKPGHRCPRDIQSLHLSVYVTAHVTPHFSARWQTCCCKLDGILLTPQSSSRKPASYSFIQNDLCPSEQLLLSLNKW